MKTIFNFRFQCCPVLSPNRFIKPPKYRSYMQKTVSLLHGSFKLHAVKFRTLLLPDMKSRVWACKILTAIPVIIYCVNIVFILASTRIARDKLEKKIIGKNQLKQSKLFDYNKNILLKMSMTEMYSIAVIAEFSCRSWYSEYCDKHLFSGENRQSLSKAIELVGSITRIITSLWREPSANDIRMIISRSMLTQQ